MNLPKEIRYPFEKNEILQETSLLTKDDDVLVCRSFSFHHWLGGPVKRFMTRPVDIYRIVMTVSGKTQSSDAWSSTTARQETNVRVGDRKDMNMSFMLAS